MAETVGLPPSPSFAEQARLSAIVDSSFDAIIGKDINSIITDWNPAAERMFGYTAEEAVGRSILMLIPESMQGEETGIIEKIKRGESVPSFDTIRQRKDGRLIHVSLTISPIRDAAGRIIGASKIARDITQAKENERRIRLLLREVNHRVKNQFAVVLSIIRETAGRADDIDAFVDLMRERITALSRSHDLLVSSNWSGAGFSDLARAHLEPFGHEQKIALSGPPAVLQPGAVQYLGMALHELGTNSSKYGALADAGGRVSVAWEVADAPEAPEFRLVWEETFTPRRERRVPRRGFGSVVLERIAPQSVSGTGELQRQPGHVRWSLTAPARFVLALPDSETEDEPGFAL